MAVSREALAHKAQQQRIRTSAIRTLKAAWTELGTYHQRDARRFASVAVPIMSATQRQVADTTNAFVARRLKKQPTQIRNDVFVGAAVRGGVPPEEVYGTRPFKRVWHMLGQGYPVDEAVDSGFSVVEASVISDTMLTMREVMATIQEVERAPWGYQRVPGGDACDFCLIASTQLYSTGDLMPLHNNCMCGVDIVEAFQQPGQVINPERLDAAYANNPDVAVAYKGEYGPTLVTDAQLPPIQGPRLPAGGRRNL